MVKTKAEEKEKIFRANPFDTRLDTHKLHGKYKEYWAFTVVGQYRIMFAFSGKEFVDFINIGTHEIYK
jgi:mRNA-degrading endonuclease YafQ of YafQ-DinJ toxin-antitoxin module